MYALVFFLGVFILLVVGYKLGTDAIKTGGLSQAAWGASHKLNGKKNWERAYWFVTKRTADKSYTKKHIAKIKENAKKERAKYNSRAKQYEAEIVSAKADKGVPQINITILEERKTNELIKAEVMTYIINIIDLYLGGADVKDIKAPSHLENDTFIHTGPLTRPW